MCYVCGICTPGRGGTNNMKKEYQNTLVHATRVSPFHTNFHFTLNEMGTETNNGLNGELPLLISPLLVDQN